jgi:hypothetical protein
VQGQPEPRAGLGWIATSLPEVCGLRARLVPDNGDPQQSTKNLSITSQHVLIVERLVDRHSPTRMPASGLAFARGPWRPVTRTMCMLINQT